MWPFKHKHRVDYSKSKTKMKCSLITGIPIQVSYQSFCKCGYQIQKDLSGAGWQQIAWGAEEESLYDDGPIRARPEREEEVKAVQKSWAEEMGYHLSSI